MNIKALCGKNKDWYKVSAPAQVGCRHFISTGNEPKSGLPDLGNCREVFDLYSPILYVRKIRSCQIFLEQVQKMPTLNKKLPTRKSAIFWYD